MSNNRMSEWDNTGSQHPSPLRPPVFSLFSVSIRCPFSFSPLATSFLLTSPLTCCLERPHVRAPTPQVCWSASRVAPPTLLFIAKLLIELLFLLLCLLMLLLEEGSKSDPLDESIEDDPSGEQENILY